MRVLLSWSGKLSLQVAQSFSNWLPLVVQSVKPYISADLEKGTRWASDLAAKLETLDYGIICVTRDNVNEPWINFESGAISKRVGQAKVWTFLFDLKPSDIAKDHPLLQFQATTYSDGEVFRLLKSINGCLGGDEHLEDEQLKKTFDMWWSELKTKLDKLEKIPPKTAVKKQPLDPDRVMEMLEELVESSRRQDRQLAISPNFVFTPASIGPMGGSGVTGPVYIPTQGAPWAQGVVDIGPGGPIISGQIQTVDFKSLKQKPESVDPETAPPSL